MTDKKEDQNEEAINLIYSLAKEKLEQTSSVFDSYNTKATLLFIAVGFVVQLLPNQPLLIPIKITVKETVLLDGKGVYWIGLMLILTGIIYLFLVFDTVDRNLPPKIRILKEKYINKSSLYIKKALIESYDTAIEVNSEKIKQKAKNFKNAFSVILLALIYFLILKSIV